MNTRREILNLVRQYYQEKFASRAFDPRTDLVITLVGSSMKKNLSIW
jgi:uncharacterized protein YbcI